MPLRARIKKIAVFLIFIFSLFIPQAFAQGGGLSLSEIDALIKQSDYDKALEGLSVFIKKYPEKFDQAQKRVDAIMKARSYYTKLANDLLDVMEKEPENAEKKLAIIRELESLEKNPTQEHLAFIRQAKAAAQFTYYRAQFRRIMEDGAKETQGQRYADAISLVQSGFYMYRDEFYDENPASVTAAATQALLDLNGAAAEYVGMRSSWNDAYRAFVQAVESGSYAASLRAWENFKARIEEAAEARNKILFAAESFGASFLALKKENPELTEASYLPFMRAFALGVSSIRDSGILGAFDHEWTQIFESAKLALYRTAKEKFDGALKDCPVQNAMQSPFAPNAALLLDADNFLKLSLSLCALDSLKRPRPGEQWESPDPLYAFSIESAKNYLDGIKASLENLDSYKAASARLSSLKAPEDSVLDARNGAAYQNDLLYAMQSLEECERAARNALDEQWHVAYKGALEGTAADEKNAGAEKSFDKIFDFKKQMDLYQDINSLSESSAIAKANEARTALFDDCEKVAGLVFSNSENLFAEAESLLESHYPDRALLKVEEIQRSIAGDKSLLLAMRARIENNAGRGRAALEKIDESVLALDGWSGQGARLASSARQEMLLSQSALDQADEMYRQAERSFLAENFSSARSSLQRSRELYNESLSHQESEGVRSRSDKNLLDLGRRINEAENRIIVGEVRSLKTRAKNEYYAGNFESAENLLNRAESRWAVTNVEEDEEIRNLKLLVQNALSMKTGREIKPTAPLYPEMSQILSNARQYFDQGSSLMKSGRRSEALEILAEAKKKLQELQLVYPLNQEAALLTLRIDELVDPAQFNESFSRRVAAARQSARVAATQQQGYSDLLDLAQIRPDYPGLKKLIYDIEIEIGVRQRPVDQSAQRRSNSLAREAERLYQNAGGNEEILRNALSRLDEAISLNPNNESAIMLKDRIQIAVGGKAAVVLSSADEARYNQAIQELRNNNIVGAYTIVERLLQTPQNRRSSKILDLQKQVQARM